MNPPEMMPVNTIFKTHTGDNYRLTNDGTPNCLAIILRLTSGSSVTSSDVDLTAGQLAFAAAVSLTADCFLLVLPPEPVLVDSLT